MEMQQVWRTLSKSGHSGYYVWEVIEVVGAVNKPPSYFTECSDGSFIYVQCFHHFTEEKALEYLNHNEAWMCQELTIIETPIDDTGHTTLGCGTCGSAICKLYHP